MQDLSKLLSITVILGFLGYAAASNEAVKKVEIIDFVKPVGILEVAGVSDPTKFFSHGSGVFITPTRFLTADHVIEKLVLDKGKELVGRVRTEDGSLYKIIGTSKDDHYDIALVTVDHEYKGPIPSINCLAQPRGTELITVGNPMSMEFLESKITVTGGRVVVAQEDDVVPPLTEKEPLIRRNPSKMIPNDDPPPRGERPAKADDIVGLEFFQGVALPGQSGAPIFTKDGDVVGVLTVSVTDQRSGSFTGLGLYVKTESTCEFLRAATKK